MGTTRVTVAERVLASWWFLPAATDLLLGSLLHWGWGPFLIGIGLRFVLALRGAK